MNTACEHGKAGSGRCESFGAAENDAAFAAFQQKQNKWCRLADEKGEGIKVWALQSVSGFFGQFQLK